MKTKVVSERLSATVVIHYVLILHNDNWLQVARFAEFEHAKAYAWDAASGLGRATKEIKKLLEEVPE